MTKLHEVYNYYSDHLPTGVTFSFTNESEVSIISWNVLNKAYMKWIDKNEQGLKGSLISKLHGKDISEKDKLDERERCIVAAIGLFISNDVDIICLQEVSQDIYKKFKSLSEVYGISIISSDEKSKDVQLVIYKNTIKYIQHKITDYKGERCKKITDVIFDINDVEFNVINSHVPFKDMKSCSDYLLAMKSEIAIACGDFNKDEDQMRDYAVMKKFSSVSNMLTHVRARTKSNKDKVRQFDFILCKDSDIIKSSKQISLELLGVDKVHRVLKEAKEGKIEIDSL